MNKKRYGAIIKNPEPATSKLHKMRKHKSAHTVKLPTKQHPLTTKKKIIEMTNPIQGLTSVYKKQFAPQESNIYISPPPLRKAEDLDFIPILLAPIKGVSIFELIESAKLGGIPFSLFANRIINTSDPITVVKSKDPADILRVLFISSEAPFVLVMRRPIKRSKWIYNGINKLITTKKSTIIYSRGNQSSANGSTILLSRKAFVKQGSFYNWGWDWISGLEWE